MERIGTSEAARILGVKPKTVREWVAAERLTPERLGGDGRGTMVFDRSAVIALRDERIAADRARLAELEASA